MLCMSWLSAPSIFCVFFFNDTATTEIYTLSLHDALPIFPHEGLRSVSSHRIVFLSAAPHRDRKSTRLNSSHVRISYAVFCLKKTKTYSPNESAERLQASAPLRGSTRHLC